MHYYSHKHGAQRRRNALSNPVAKSIAVRKIQQHLRGIQTLAYLMQDGEDAADELAHMAWILGLGAEVAFSIDDEAQARPLHIALRTVHGLALDGYRWRASVAPLVDVQLGVAERLINRHADIAWTMLGGAEWLAHRITTRTTRHDDVAGAELYAQPAAATTPGAEMRGLAPAAHGGGGARPKAGGVEGQQAPAGPESADAAARLSASGSEVMDEGQAARAASPARSSQRREAAC